MGSEMCIRDRSYLQGILCTQEYSTDIAAGTAGGFDTDTFDDDDAGTYAEPAARVVADTSARTAADSDDGVVVDTAAVVVAGSHTNDRDRWGNHVGGRIGAVATPTTIAADTESTAAGRGRGRAMQRVSRSVKWSSGTA